VDTKTAESMNDHDLLIRVSTLVENLSNDIKSYDSNTKATMLDHENRIRALTAAMEQDRGARRNGNLLLGLLGAAGTSIGIFATVISLMK